MGGPAPILKLQTNPGAIVVWGSNSANQIKGAAADNDSSGCYRRKHPESWHSKDGSLMLWSLLGGNNVADPIAPAGPIPAGVRSIDAVLLVTHGLAVAVDGILYPFGHFAQPPSITTPPPPNTEPAGLKGNKDLAEAGHSVASGWGAASSSTRIRISANGLPFPILPTRANSRPLRPMFRQASSRK
jgi:hypothetical protein